MTSFFENGCKTDRTLGFELEHVLLRKGSDAPVSYTETGGVHDVLEKLAPRYRSASYDGNDIVGLSRCREAITIEPAGQLEISAGPFERVSEVQKAYEAFRADLDPILDELGLYTPYVGYNPSAKAKDLQVIPKRRYECMTKFLGAQAYSALCMMRCTTSLQISIDYTDEQDAATKLRVAQKATPILALICDNVSVFETEPVEGHLARTGVWLGMWQDRVGTIPGSLDPTYGFADYADYIMTRQAILTPDENEESGWRYVADQTFDEIYADKEMSDSELEHALSMVWPDARLKNFVEIRPADALPPALAYAYTALIKSIFYSDDALRILDQELVGADEAGIVDAKRALMRDGYGATVYDKPATYWADLIVRLAEEGASTEDATYLGPLSSLVAARLTPAESHVLA
ncbi:MAG: glutamate--cysteine ligase [Eggerthellaceae bacterium]|nr:glutamate--cysteine ligase [Eggerthellaceae bacterium]